MAITSFYHAIYKRLWGVARVANAHMDDGSMDGGFTLLSPGEPHGIFGTIQNSPSGGVLAGQTPIVASNLADNNPIYKILQKSLTPPLQLSTPVPGQAQMWPVMPFPVGNPLSIQGYPSWVTANNGMPKLIDKLKEWIEVNNKANDTPHGGNLDFAHWSGGPAAFPSKNKQILFVCSVDKDNGVRPGNV